jgi:hypothetical protein
VQRDIEAANKTREHLSVQLAGAPVMPITVRKATLLYQTPTSEALALSQMLFTETPKGEKS